MSYVSPTVAYCAARGLRLTRELFIDSCYPSGVPAPWGAELEAELPDQFRLDAPAPA
jgi:hypothetical protein